MNKKNAWIVVLVVVVVVLVVIGIVAIDKNVAKAPVVSGVGTTAPLGTSTVGQTTSTASSSPLTVTPSTSTAQKSYVAASFSLDYPGSWVASTTSFFSLNNFGGKYQNGGMIPVGGAEIDVVTTTVYSSVSEIMTTELMSATNVATSTVTLDNIVCKKAVYDNSYATGFPSDDTSIYCLRGSELWKIYFSYHAGDPAAQEYVSDFSMVLNSIKFLP